MLAGGCEAAGLLLAEHTLGRVYSTGLVVQHFACAFASKMQQRQLLHGSNGIGIVPAVRVAGSGGAAGHWLRCPATLLPLPLPLTPPPPARHRQAVNSSRPAPLTRPCRRRELALRSRWTLA
jgi:hypothetical protein